MRRARTTSRRSNYRARTSLTNDIPRRHRTPRRRDRSRRARKASTSPQR
jgi:hypothetical protein